MLHDYRAKRARPHGLEVLVWRPILSAADLDRTLDFIANVLRSGLATPAIPARKPEPIPRAATQSDDRDRLVSADVSCVE